VPLAFFVCLDFALSDRTLLILKFVIWKLLLFSPSITSRRTHFTSENFFGNLLMRFAACQLHATACFAAVRRLSCFRRRLIAFKQNLS